jgi:amino acid adenylation domain-containing protein
MARRLVPAGQLAHRAAINATAAPLGEELLQGLFAAQVRQRPDQVAVVSRARTLRYGDLYRYSNRIGRHLRELGARSNTVVAVVMEKGWEQVVGVLGVVMSGAAYLPIDAGLPRERLWHILRDAEVELVLTQSWVDAKLAWPEKIRRLSVDKGEFEPVADSSLEPAQRSEDLAYVIYTSGSTGLPKGVMISHRAVVNTIMDINERFNVGPQDRVLALASLAFDLSVYDIFGILAAGGTVVMPEASGVRDPAHWAELISEKQVTVWNSVPAMMEMFVDYLAERPELRSESLRLALLSGDWIPRTLPQRIQAVLNGIEMVSLGGATEASIWSILYPLSSNERFASSIPYGKPMRNQSVQILNEVGAPCPVWVVGQLHIGGCGVAEGYWRDEARTMATFIKDPETGRRIYQTGDIGRYLPDGNIELLGRQDSRVKIDGHRIELEEIEGTLLQHRAVRAAAVIAVDTPPGKKRLVAYIVLSPEMRDNASTVGMHEAWAPVAVRRVGDSLERDRQLATSKHVVFTVSKTSHDLLVSDLKAFLEHKLPYYMTPSSFVTLPSLPRTANGKIDRGGLAALGASGVESEPCEAPPRTKFERAVAAVWQEILQIERVGVDENFFELGGNSLMMVKAYGRLQKMFARTLSMVEMFEYPTVKSLAVRLSRERNR